MSGRDRSPDSPLRPPVAGSAAVVAGLLAALLLLASPGQAQERFDIGGHGSFATELAGGSLGVGARASLGLEPLLDDVRLQVTGDLFFPNCVGGGDCDFEELNVNLILDAPGRREEGGSYLGVGLNAQRLNNPTDPRGAVDDVYYGANAVLGFGLEPQGPIQPFVEARVEFLTDGVEQLVLSAGVVL